MATNFKRFSHALNLEVAVASGTTSGDVVAVGQMVGVAITDRDSSGNAVVAFPFAYTVDVAVTGEDAAGAAAVAIGDRLYLDSGAVNKDATNGVPFGFALEAVSSGATSTIEVAVAQF